MIALLLALALQSQPAPAVEQRPLSAQAQAAVDAVRKALDAERARQAAAGPPETVKGELARRVRLEQAGRRAMSAVFALPEDERRAASARAWAMVKPLDDDNTAWLKRHLPADGWFRISRDGVQATQAAFLIVQHSGDQAWMKQVLARMEPLAKRGEVRGGDYALLYDRTALAEGRPQRYGSQVGCVAGRVDFSPIEDPAGVEARRKAVGLDTLAEYRRHFPNLGQPC